MSETKIKEVRYSLDKNPCYSETSGDFETFLEDCKGENLEPGDYYFEFDVSYLKLSNCIDAESIINDLIENANIDGVDDWSDCLYHRDIKELKKIIGDWIDNKLKFEQIGEPVKKQFTKNDIEKINGGTKT